MNKIIYTENAPEPIGPYSQAILSGNISPDNASSGDASTISSGNNSSGNILFCSGQLALDARTGAFIGGNITEQTQKTVENISAVLDAAGMGFENVVKTTCFLASMEDFAEFNAVYEQHFISKPARSCIAAKELPKGALVEIECIAMGSQIL